MIPWVVATIIFFLQIRRTSHWEDSALLEIAGLVSGNKSRQPVPRPVLVPPEYNSSAEVQNIGLCQRTLVSSEKLKYLEAHLQVQWCFQRHFCTHFVTTQYYILTVLNFLSCTKYTKHMYFKISNANCIHLELFIK